VGSPFGQLSETREMRLSANALEQLELLGNAVDGAAWGSLWGLMNRTLTPFGARLLRHWVSESPQPGQDMCTGYKGIAARPLEAPHLSRFARAGGGASGRSKCVSRVSPCSVFLSKLHMCTLWCRAVRERTPGVPPSDDPRPYFAAPGLSHRAPGGLSLPLPFSPPTRDVPRQQTRRGRAGGSQPRGGGHGAWRGGAGGSGQWVGLLESVLKGAAAAGDLERGLMRIFHRTATPTEV